MGMPDQDKLKDLLLRIKSLACEYYVLTQKPLGVTGEVAELEAADKLGLELAGARTPFYDGFRQAGSDIKRFQIKGRAVALRTLIVDAYHLLSAMVNLIPCFLCSSIKQHSKQSRFGRRRGRKLSDGCKLQDLGRGMNGDQWGLPNSNRSRRGSGREGQMDCKR
jgi:hypothetical protein